MSTAIVREIKRCGTLFASVAIAVVVCEAQSVTGVVYSNHHGYGRNPGGQVRLAFAGSIVGYEYAPASLNFKQARCLDIGAVWTGRTASIDGSPDIGQIKCEGRVDKKVHSAWLTVRNYLDRLDNPNLGDPSVLLTPRAHSEGANELLREADLGGYKSSGESGRCLDVLSVAQVVRIGAGTCFIQGIVGDCLIFDVVWNDKTQRWIIDSVKAIPFDDYWKLLGELRDHWPNGSVCKLALSHHENGKLIIEDKAAAKTLN